MFLGDLVDVKTLFSSFKGDLIGVGMTAYSRHIPSYFCPDYKIVAAHRTGELQQIRQKVVVFCIEDAADFQEAIGFNSYTLLNHSLTREYLQYQQGPLSLLLYQNYPELEKLAEKEGWRLLANPADLRNRLEDRAFFIRLMDELGLSEKKGTVYAFEDFLSLEYETCKKTLTEKFVVKLAEIKYGGGKGNFFIFNRPDFDSLKYLLKNRTWRNTLIENFILRPYIEGESVSLALCITRHGILFSGIQKQLIDLSYTQNLKEKGIFCGHSWGGKFSVDMQNEIYRQAGLIGDRLVKMGYRGILGLDFIANEDTEQVFPIEINPRYTGAFPMLSQLHIHSGIIPMDVFHILEFLEVPYEIDIDELNAAYKREIKGSHLIVFRLEEDLNIDIGGINAGLYEFSGDTGDPVYKRPGTGFDEIGKENRFIIADGPLLNDSNGPHDPLERFCKVIFPYPVMNNRAEGISEKAISTLNWVHKQLTKY